MASILPQTDLRQRYQHVRALSEWLCEPLEVEDFVVQSMPDVSPTRWHLAHTTWFFETFVLARANRDYSPVNAAFEFLFNSYYNSVGEQYPRSERGMLTRPTVSEVFEYRRQVDDRMEHFFDQIVERSELAAVVELGLHHEQQHQELILTDIKHVLSRNPLFPVYRDGDAMADSEIDVRGWRDYPGGLESLGHEGDGFAFDNESPRHRVFLEPYSLDSRLVTNGEYLEFIEDGGYRRPELWLSQGWSAVNERGWDAPQYWRRRDNRWRQFTLSGLRDPAANEPVCHVSYFEADAFARWRGARLPTEAEWEVAASGLEPLDNIRGNFVEQQILHPAPHNSQADADEQPVQLYGDVWEWTSSQYTAYPGFAPASGALGEYNGKFMCNQFVLRGGSCATSRSHIRSTYRNFFPPDARWQFTGIRLAR